MEIKKNMKAGYQGKYDSMRAMAERLLKPVASGPEVIFSASAADKDKMRLYKTGGVVDSKKEMTKKEKAPLKLALGGVAKIRHKEANKKGQPIKPKKV